MFPAHMTPKQRAAEAALEFVKPNMVVGLGTGSTADYFLIGLAERLRDGRLSDIVGVPTSLQSERRAKELGIPLASLAEQPSPDITIDGADEVDPRLDAIKGLGGALLREKIVAQSTKHFILIIDQSKQVQQLGTRSPLPVEVTPFGHEVQAEFLRSLGCTPSLRRNDDGSVFMTDNHNVIYHCRFNGIPDARALQTALKSRAGIVESGLFLNMARTVVTAGDNEITIQHR